MSVAGWKSHKKYLGEVGSSMASKWNTHDSVKLTLKEVSHQVTKCMIVEASKFQLFGGISKNLESLHAVVLLPSHLFRYDVFLEQFI